MQSSSYIFKGSDTLVICYFDDLLTMGKSENHVNEFKLKLASKLPSNNMVEASGYLGMEIVQTVQSISLCQKMYADTLVSEMGLSECSRSIVPYNTSVGPSTKGKVSGIQSLPYHKLIGTLLYIAMYTRPDIAVVTCILVRHVENPSISNQKTALKVVKYLNETSAYTL